MTVRHRQKEFNDAILRPYGATKRVCGNYFGDECEIAIVSGMPEGVGKSGYIHDVLSDVYGYLGCKDPTLIKTMQLTVEERVTAPKWPSDWEAAKSYIRYLPEEIVDLCKTMLVKGLREPVFHWDDAGACMQRGFRQNA